MRNCGGRWPRWTSLRKWLGCTDAYSNTVTVATTMPWLTAPARLVTGFNGTKTADHVSAQLTAPTHSRGRPAHGLNRPASHNMPNGRPRPSTLRLRPLNPLVQRTRGPKPKRCGRLPLHWNG